MPRTLKCTNRPNRIYRSHDTN